MIKTKMKTGDYYSADYRKYPLKSLRPFILITCFLLLLFSFVLAITFNLVDTDTQLSAHACLVVFLLYWMYLSKKHALPYKNLKESILERTKFEKMTAKLKFQAKKNSITK